MSESTQVANKSILDDHVLAYRNFRNEFSARSYPFLSAACSAPLADAYIALLDEQAALQVPYDWEWLEARPEFERIGLSLVMDTRNGLRIVVWQGIQPRWYLRHVAVLELGRTSWVDTPIPTPATKADVIKLLEVFS